MVIATIKINLVSLILALVVTLVTFSNAHAQLSYFKQGYAHNDYLHKTPLFEALSNGYTNIEADVFLFKDSLVVAHWFPYLKGNRTLESLYLAPLSQLFRDNPDFIIPPITLVIDIKSSPQKTYFALRSLLEKYTSILSSVNGRVYKQGRVNIVLTGNKPAVYLISHEANRLVMLDDMLDQVLTGNQNHLFAMASCKYSKVLHWTGKSRIPAKEKTKLLNLVKIAHSQGKKVRLWASPENENVWNELLNCGVDYINTDKLVKLKDFYYTYFAPFEPA